MCFGRCCLHGDPWASWSCDIGNFLPKAKTVEENFTHVVFHVTFEDGHPHHGTHERFVLTMRNCKIGGRPNVRTLLRMSNLVVLAGDSDDPA